MPSPFVRSWLLKEILSLPAAVLRALSGGGVVYRDGRTLDADIQFLWRAWFDAAPGRVPLGLAGRDLDEVRVEWREAASLLEPSGLRVRNEPIGGDAASATFGLAPINGLLIRPQRISHDAPLLVFFHQGGGSLGGSDLSKAFCAVFAEAAGCPVFLPDYRLAPDHRFPAAYDDARLAFDWAQANATRMGSPSGAVAVGGALIGANLATRLCMDLKRDFKPLPVAQLLVTPLVDLADPQIKARSTLGLWPLTSADIELMIANYAGASVELTDPRISPALEKLIIGQPRTLVASAGLDPLATQGEAFAKRLIEARTRTIYRRYDTLPLGFDLFAGVVAAARAATLDIAETWVELLRSGVPDAAEDEAA